MALVVDGPTLIGLIKKAQIDGGKLYGIKNRSTIIVHDGSLKEIGIIDLGSETYTSNREGRSDSRNRQEFVNPNLHFDVYKISPKRKTGTFAIHFQGNNHEFHSQKELLEGGLKLLERARPGTFDKLENIQPRSKRIVSRRRESLFTDPNLVEKYSKPIAEGWWMGTNNSKEEARRWLERACQLAGFRFGIDFVVEW